MCFARAALSHHARQLPKAVSICNRAECPKTSEVCLPHTGCWRCLNSVKMKSRRLKSAGPALDRRSFVIFAASALPAHNLSHLAKVIAIPDQTSIYVCPPCGLECDRLTFDKPGTCPVCSMTLIQRLKAKSGGPLTVDTLMESYKVPGLSVAIIDDFKIAATKVYRVTEAGGATPVTSRTLFQAGSVSKPVAATGALRLVQDGKLSLDKDVNRSLKS